MTIVVDASAVLAVCKQEAGSEEAKRRMRGGLISAVNLSEVWGKTLPLKKQDIARSIIEVAGITVVPFGQSEAVAAAQLAIRTRSKGISFADRACLALASVEGLPVLTGDHRWAELGLDLKVELFRQRTN